MGIPEEERERIFDRGVRLDTGKPGTGLGLAIVRDVAEIYDGTVAWRRARIWAGCWSRSACPAPRDESGKAGDHAERAPGITKASAGIEVASILILAPIGLRLSQLHYKLYSVLYQRPCLLTRHCERSEAIHLR